MPSSDDDDWRDNVAASRSMQPWPAAPWQPPIDVLVGSEIAWIRLAAPGSATGDIRVLTFGRTVVLAGRRAGQRPPEGVRYVRAEIAFGPFRRRIELPWEPHPTPHHLEAHDGIVEIALTRATAGRRDDE